MHNNIKITFEIIMKKMSILIPIIIFSFKMIQTFNIITRMVFTEKLFGSHFCGICLQVKFILKISIIEIILKEKIIIGTNMDKVSNY